MSSYPDFVLERINKLSEETKISASTLRSEYSEIFPDEFVQQDEQFKTEKQRHVFALKVLIARTRPGKLSTEDPRRAEA